LEGTSGFDILLLGLFGPFILKRLGVLACFSQGVCAPSIGSAFFLLVFVCLVFGKRDFRSKHIATCILILATPLHLGFSIESSSFEALNVLSTAILLL